MPDWWSPTMFQKEKCQRKGPEIRRNGDDDDDNSYNKCLNRIPANVSAVLTEVFRGSPQCVQLNARMLILS
jgi:hypothetical protein